MPRIRSSYWPLLILLFWSCRKDVESFQPYAPSAEDLSHILAEKVPSGTTQSIFILNYLNTDKVLETNSGIRIFLIDTDHLFADAGSGLPVLCSTCPDFKVEVTEVMDKRDIVARGLNTISANGMLFESAGMVHITATCGGKVLTLLPGRDLKIQLPNHQPESGFFVFNQNVSGNDQHWTNSGQEIFNADWPVNNGTQTGYEMLVHDLGWVACGRLLPDQTSTFCISLPAGFADQNTLAYIVFKNQTVVAPLKFDLQENRFCFEDAPAGYLVQLVSVSRLGTRYWLGKGETEIGTNATIPVNTQQTTEDAVLTFVKGL